jgi:predicted Zn finger-like uncharacterized protein
MIIVCSNCSTRLQVNDEKARTRPFVVRCPKCSNTVNSGSASPATEKSGLAVGGSPSTERKRFEQNIPAPAFELAGEVTEKQAATSVDDAVRLLASLLGKVSESDLQTTEGGSSKKRRKTLVCASEAHRELIAGRLSKSGYQVYVAEDTRQAVERMRANPLDIVLLEQQFDTAEQGATFVVREINVLRPTQRRRIFFALLSPSLRTMDAHSAFLNNVNAVVNLSDIEDLPRILGVALRDYNELYRDFNSAFSLTAL